VREREGGRRERIRGGDRRDRLFKAGASLMDDVSE
jgi:hypothetical protein